MKIFDPKLTGSIEILNEITGDVTMSANLLVEGNLSGNITGSASTASYIELSNVDGSASLASRIFDNSSSIASLEAVSGSYANSSSFASNISANSASIASLEIISGSYANSASFASDISSNSASIGSLNAVSSSYLLNTTDTLTGDLTVTGNIIATTLNVQDVTASVIYSSGSNIFGSSSIDTQQFTGSILTSGSIEVNGDKFTVSGATGNTVVGGTLNSGAITSTGAGTFARDVTANGIYSAGQSAIIYKAQRSGGAVAGDWSYDDATTDMSLGTSTSHSFSLKTGNTRALTISNSQNATFAGNVTISKSNTAELQLIDTTNNVSLLFGADDNNTFLRNSSGLMLFQTNGGTTALTLSGANSTFAGDVTVGNEVYLDNGKYLRFERSSGGLSIQTLGIEAGTDDVRLLTSGAFNLVNGGLTNLLNITNGGNATFAGTVKGSTYLINLTTAAGIGTTLGDINGAELGPGYLTVSRDDTANAKQISFYKNNVEHSYLETTSNGLNIGGANVGIGTDSPQTKLDVRGGTGGGTFAHATFTSVTNRGLKISTENSSGGQNGAAVVYNAQDGEYYGSHEFQVGGLEKMRIDSSGNVMLDVNNWLQGHVTQRAGTQNLIRSRAMGYPGYYGLQIGQETNHISLFIDPLSVAGGAFSGNVNELMLPNKVIFQQANAVTSPTDWLNGQSITLDNGKVGIGINTPSYKLDVESISDSVAGAYIQAGKSSQGEIQNTGLIIGSRTDTATGDYIGISFSGNASVPARGRAAIGAVSINGASGMDLVFMTRNAGDGSQLGSSDEKMRIDSSGRVLINTPVINNSYLLQIDSESGGGIWVGGGGTGDANFLSDSSTVAWHYYAFTGASQKFGINTAGVVYSTSTSIVAISDERLKENVKDLETGLKEVLALKPRRFDWKKNEGTKEKNVAGFIAQEVKEVLPDLVYSFEHSELNEVKSLKMGDMIPTLVKAIQELKAEIEILKNK